MRTKFFAIAGMLLAAAIFLGLRKDVDQVPPSLPLELLPTEIAGWRSHDIALDPAVIQVLGDGKFLNRDYEPASREDSTAAHSGPVGLFIGYFPTQRTGQAIHSPQNCLPGAGWTFLSGRPYTLTDVNGKRYDVAEYLITDGTHKVEVLYWYRQHGRSIANEYRAKLYMIADAMRYNRTDGALVRVITPMQTGETEAQAHNRAVLFASNMAPMLPAYIPD